MSHFRIYFLRAKRGGSLVERLTTKAIYDFNNLFGYREHNNIHHVVVEFNNRFYEVTLDGTITYTTDNMMSHPRLEAFWEMPLKDISPEAIEAYEFTLSRQLGRKLSVTECLSYAAQFAFADTIGYDEAREILGDTKAKLVDGVLEFSLPYTCCSLANMLLWKLLEVDLSEDSFLAPNLYITCWMLCGFGAGDFYSLTAMPEFISYE